MDSWKSILSFIFAFLLIIFQSNAASFSDSENDGVKIKNSIPATPQKVNVSVYYETLNPSCANFIVKTLTSVFNNDQPLIDIVNLRLIPWGNSHFNKTNNTTICQNGPDECLLNTIQACAIDVWTDLEKYYGFIYCIEFQFIDGRLQDWSTCFSSLGLSNKTVLDCYNNGNGTKLGIGYGYETEHLNPPHSVMPWVVVNNQSLGNNYENLTTYVCNAYKGSIVPDSCKSHAPTKTSSSREANSLFHPVFYRDETKNLEPSRPEMKRMPSPRKVSRIMEHYVGLLKPKD